MPNLVHCLSQTLCSLAGTPRGRQDSSCLGPDLALLEATSLKGPAQEGVKDAELTVGSAPTIFYTFEKVNARA